MNKCWRWYDLLFVPLFIYLLIAQVQAIWPFTIDDMYISLRYASNLAGGHGLLWNTNTAPVEGYSNFSFVLLGALSLILKLNPVVVLKLAGWLGLYVTAVFIFLISRLWFDIRTALIPCIFLLLYKGQIIWAVSGLETTVFQALIAGTVYLLLRGLGYNTYPQTRGRPHRGYSFCAGLLLALAGLTRPETPGLMLLFGLLALWDKGNAEYRKDYWRALISFLIPLAVIYLPYFAWRWHYFGYLFPNAVYCKGFVGHSFELIEQYLYCSWPLMLLSLLVLCYAKDRKGYFLLLPSAVYIVMLINSDPIVAFDNRLFLAAWMLLLPLAVQGISLLLLFYFKEQDSIYQGCLFFLSFLFIWFFMPMMSLADYHYFSKRPVLGERLRAQVVSQLNILGERANPVVLADAGLIPYYSKLQFTDSYCLNNFAMAHSPEHLRYEQFCQQMKKQRPPVIILTSLSEAGKVIYTPADVCLKKMIKADSGYKLLNSFHLRDENALYRYELFVNF